MLVVGSARLFFSSLHRRKRLAPFPTQLFLIVKEQPALCCHQAAVRVFPDPVPLRGADRDRTDNLGAYRATLSR
jgi:hypothetical protein